VVTLSKVAIAVKSMSVIRGLKQLVGLHFSGSWLGSDVKAWYDNPFHVFISRFMNEFKEKKFLKDLTPIRLDLGRKPKLKVYGVSANKLMLDGLSLVPSPSTSADRRHSQNP